MTELYSRPVIREDGVEFPSIRAAEKYMNICNGGIGQAIRRNGKCKGYKWSFKYPRVWSHPDIHGEEWLWHPTLPIQVSDHGRVKYRGRTTPGTTSDIEPIYKQIVVLKNRYDVGLLVIQTFFDHTEGFSTYKRINDNLLDNKLSNFELNDDYNNPINGTFFNHTHESRRYYMLY